jgi:hypothetical protein
MWLLDRIFRRKRVPRANPYSESGWRTMDDRGRLLHMLIDKEARTSGKEHPGMNRPPGSPVYYGFPIVNETLTDGWRLGSVTAFEDPLGCTHGDAFVVAPDGTRAGITWEVGTAALKEVVPPDAERWGVYAVSFPSSVHNVEDLAKCFRAVLPELQAVFAEVAKSKVSTSSE